MEQLAWRVRHLCLLAVIAGIAEQRGHQVITRIGAAIAALVWIAPEPAREAAAQLPQAAIALQLHGAGIAITAAQDFCRGSPEKCAAAAVTVLALTPQAKPRPKNAVKAQVPRAS